MPALEFLFEAFVTLGVPSEVGSSARARKRLTPITGGTVRSHRINGDVLPGGGDWQTVEALAFYRVT